MVYIYFKKAALVSAGLVNLYSKENSRYVKSTNDFLEIYYPLSFFLDRLEMDSNWSGMTVSFKNAYWGFSASLIKRSAMGKTSSQIGNIRGIWNRLVRITRRLFKAHWPSFKKFHLKCAKCPGLKGLQVGSEKDDQASHLRGVTNISTRTKPSANISSPVRDARWPSFSVKDKQRSLFFWSMLRGSQPWRFCRVASVVSTSSNLSENIILPFINTWTLAFPMSCSVRRGAKSLGWRG